MQCVPAHVRDGPPVSGRRGRHVVLGGAGRDGLARGGTAGGLTSVHHRRCARPKRRKRGVYTDLMPSRVLAMLALAWSLVAGASAVRAALAQPPDPTQRLEAEFVELVPRLPPSGEVGYLDRYQNAGDDDALRARYAAQYAFAPRVLLS